MTIGIVQSFAARSFILPIGLLISTFLTRRLGPELYGQYSVAAAIIFWIQLATSRTFRHTTTKFVAEAGDGGWRDVASTIIQTQFLVSLGAAVLLVVAAPALASWLNSTELTTYLRLFALDIPLFALANAHVSTLTGREAFGQQAILLTSRWLTRLALVLLLVGLGLSVTGAILAGIGASAMQLILARVYVRPSLVNRPIVSSRHIGGYALPLLFYEISISLFGRLDLLLVKALSSIPEAAGFYAAAKNLSILPGLLADSIAPLLLATLTKLWREGRADGARDTSMQVLRFLFILLPFAGIVAGSSAEIISLIYGDPFLPSAPLLALMIFGALAFMMMSVTMSLLIAIGHPGLAFGLTAPLVPLAYLIHLIAIPRFGPVGAAAVTTALASIEAGATMLAAHRLCGVRPGFATLIRTGLATLAAYAMASAWQVPGILLIVKLLVLTVAVVALMFLLGELTKKDWENVRSLLKRKGPRLSTQAESKT